MHPRLTNRTAVMSACASACLLLLSQHAIAEAPRSGNPIVPGWYADPEARIFEGEYWIYPTYSAPYGEQIFMDAFSSKDLVTWKKHARVLDIADVGWAKRALWAPSVVEKDGWYYLFFGANDIQNDQELGGIGVARARRPEGPFKDHLGKPLVDAFHNGAQPIDQFVFKDADGSHYIIYGGWRHCNIAKLKDDFTGLVPFADGTTFKEITPKGYVEGAFMFLKDGKYYFMWSEGGWTGPDYAVAYAVASSPFGPFERVGKILQQDPSVATGAGHHSVLHAPGSDNWYIAYHRRPLGETDANHRVVCIDLMRFDDKGLILPVAITKEGVPPDVLPASASQVVVVISADTEWRAVRSVLPAEPVTSSPYGEFFTHAIDTAAGRQQVIVFHGGWGKIAAAGSAQYVIDRWRPELLVNLGTCGGFRGAIERGEILLVERTVVYDIVEQMGDAAEAIAAYTSEIDLRWVGSELPPGVRRGPLVSADRDLLPADIPRLRKAYGAVAGDWESGAIAWVAQRNQTQALILKGVSDLVDSRGGEAYGTPNAFEVGARAVMKRLLQDLPLWLDRFGASRDRAAVARKG